MTRTRVPAPDAIAAAHDLTMAGRAAEAVAVLEDSRAFLFNELLQRRQYGIHRLREMGHGELLDRYLADAAIMHQMGPLRSGGPELVATKERLQATTAEIQAIPGFAGFLTPPTYEELVALRYSDPVVYLVAAPDRGFALIVWPNAPDAPQVIDCPAMTEEKMRDLALRALWAFHIAPAEAEEARKERLESVTEWAWGACMERVTDALAGVGRATLIPVDLLNVLPLHLAWRTRPDGTREYVMDRVLYRSSPNLRIAAHVRPAADTAAHGVLACAPATAALPWSEFEALRAVARQGGTVLRDGQATLDAVRRELPHHGVWHVASHARVNLEVPWASSLQLGDGEATPLTALESVAARDTRLAVLSACTAAQAGLPRPELAVSLANVALIAGFRGVIAPQWRVWDHHTALLMSEFYELLDPALTNIDAALRDAQIWLRDTSDAEILERFRSFDVTRDQSWLTGRRHAWSWGAFAMAGA